VESLLGWVSHREASSGVWRSGDLMPKRRGEREAVVVRLSARPSGGGRGAGAASGTTEGGAWHLQRCPPTFCNYSKNSNEFELI
jgi:hypothetical protein